MKNLSLFILSFLLISSCSKEVDIDDFIQDNKLVINSYLQSDSVISVYLSKIHKHSDTTSSFVNSADVGLYDENNIFLEKLINIEGGLYISQNTIVEQGKKYKIETKYNNETVFASDIVPELIEIEKLEYTGNSIYNEEFHESFEIEISFIDNPNLDNYYEIVPYLKQTDTINFYYSGEKEIFHHWYLQSNDPIFLNEDYDNNGIYDAIVFSDKDFSGNIQKIKFYYNFITIINSSETYHISHVLKLELRAISKSYYLYKKSLMKHLNNQYSDFWYGTANPISLYSNIQNGYGIFAAFSYSCDSLVYTNTISPF